MPNNGSVNTLPHRCNDVTVTMSICHVTCVFCRRQPARQWTGKVANTWHVFSVRGPCHVRGPCQGVILKTFGTTTRLRELDYRVEVSQGKFVVEEELKVWLWRLNVWFEDSMCAVVQWYWEFAIKWDFHSSSVKSVARKRIVKTLFMCFNYSNP
jgi:hypothetical protein